ncbi:MAG: thioredoxin family protein [Bacteroidetes bacterium]|nr:thioredoxin family protein [Bacteroidota bacterium]
MNPSPLSIQDYWHLAMPIGAYLDALMAFEPKADDPYLTYYAINNQRVKRLRKTTQLDTDTMKRYWLVINEFWCGDGAQITPVIESFTNASGGGLETRVVFRDEHPALIDAFLTNGSRSVPKIIQLNEQFEVLGSWGPRPKAAQDLVVQLKSNPETAGNYSEWLHKWYADDHQRSTQKELLAFVSSTL